MAGLDELFQGQEIIDESTLPDAGGQNEPEAIESSALEPSEPAGAEPETQHREPKHVPLAALQEERQRRQEYKEELERERQRAAQMETRFQQMLERMNAQQQPPAPPEQPIPEFLEDPAGHVAALREKYERDMAESRQFRQQVEQQQAYQNQQAQLFTAVQRAEAEFAREHQDYPEASNYFAEKKLAEYRSYGLDEGAARTLLAQDFQKIAVTAFQQGRNPAEFVHGAAKAWGYGGTAQPQKTAPAASQGPSRATNGQFAPKAPTTLATANGSPRQPDEGGELSLEKIAQMTDKEFDVLWDRMARGQTVMPKI